MSPCGASLVFLDGASLEFPDLLAGRWKCLGLEAAMDHLTLQTLHLRPFYLSTRST